MLTIYGSSKSRSGRVLWALEELGLKFEHVPVMPANAKSAEHLKLNPNGHVPVLKDDNFVLWESQAINLYLAEKYGKAPFWPSSHEGHGDCYRWTFWAMTEVEPNVVAVLRNRLMAPPDQRNEEAAKAGEAALKAPLKVLDDHLKGRDYLLGKDFTIADVGVAHVVSFAIPIKYDLAATPNVNGWVQKCLGREAAVRARGLP
jgi:glutathione S-transferase